MTPIIHLNGVRYCYDEVCAVEGVNLEIRPNELTVLIGPNGGGKSTIIKLIAGLLQPDTGTIDRGECTVGYVSQSPDFDTGFPATVWELVLMGTLSTHIRLFKRYDNWQKQIASSAIKRTGLFGLEKRGVGQLSGGQLRRAMIARAIASGADVIVLDEPDAGLDIDAAAELYALLGKLKADKAIVIASHHIDAVLEIADTAVYVKKNVHTYLHPSDLKKNMGISL